MMQYEKLMIKILKIYIFLRYFYVICGKLTAIEKVKIPLWTVATF